MRCKQGDLAVIVHSAAGNEGKIVRCIQRYNGPWRSCAYEPGWITDTQLLKANGKSSPHIFDKCLRPIRGQDGQDETLTWLDVPSKETICVK